MIRLDLYLNKKSVQTSLFIYETEEEFAQSGYKLADPRFAKPFDYYKTDDGYYLPIINVKDFTTKNKNMKLIKYFFPFDRLLTMTLYLDPSGDPLLSRFRRRVFTFADYRKGIKKQAKVEYLNANEIYAAELIARGISIHDAFMTAYPKTINRTYTRDSLIHRTMRKPQFVDYILERTNMDKIKQALSDMNAHKIAAQSIVELLQAVNDKGEPNLSARKFAIQAFVAIDRMIEDEVKGNESTMSFKLEEDIAKTLLLESNQ